MSLVILPHQDRFWVNCPKGCALVLAMEASRDMNYVFTVALQKDGQILHMQSTQCKMTVNYTDEINLENNKPEYPTDKLL